MVSPLSYRLMFTVADSTMAEQPQSQIGSILTSSDSPKNEKGSLSRTRGNHLEPSRTNLEPSISNRCPIHSNGKPCSVGKSVKIRRASCFSNKKILFFKMYTKRSTLVLL